MLFKSVFTIVAALATFVAADEDKGNGCGCDKPVQHHHRRCSSSSSSSSSRCDSSCSTSETRKVVQKLQDKFNLLINACDYAGAKALARPNTSVSIISAACDNEACCVENESLADFVGQYQCGDKLYYFQPNEQNIRQYPNGTVVYSQYVLNVPVADPTVMNAYLYNYHWSPVYGCNFQLTYIDGNNLGCPTYVFELQECLLCQQ